MANERLKTFDLADPETIGVYVLDIKDAGLSLDDILADGHKVRQQLRFFPSSTDLVKALVACRNIRKPPGVISHPVYVADSEGMLRVCSRDVAEKQKLRYWLHEYDAQVALGIRQPMKALTYREGQTLREAFLERVQRTAEKMAMKELPGAKPIDPRSTPEYKAKMAQIHAELEAMRAQREAPKPHKRKAPSSQKRAD